MILYVEVKVKELSELGKRYPWKRPEQCPECESRRLWGHGYAERYFEGYKEALWVKKYRCADCKAVHTLRPASYYRRFQVQWLTILLSLYCKIEFKRWLKCFSRQRQQYWWKGFLKQASRESTIKCEYLLEVMIRLILSNIILSTHSLEYFEIKPLREPPHLTFAVTPGSDFG